MRYTLSETFSGLKRNLTMTISVIVTMAVSLALFGAGLLATQQFAKLKDSWLGKIEISVFMCTKDTEGPNCDPGQDPTQEQRDLVRSTLESLPQVQTVYYENKHQAFEEFQKVTKDTSLEGAVDESQMQDSFRIKLKNPEEFEAVAASVAGLKGVQSVQDLRDTVNALFTLITALQWTMLVIGALLLLAAALQIGNAIRVAAFARRREIGIMRLVGAGNFYILLPFLLEALITALIGSALAVGALAVGFGVFVGNTSALIAGSADRIGWPDFALASAAVVVVGVVLSLVPAFLATRRYLRV